MLQKIARFQSVENTQLPSPPSRSEPSGLKARSADTHGLRGNTLPRQLFAQLDPA